MIRSVLFWVCGVVVTALGAFGVIIGMMHAFSDVIVHRNAIGGVAGVLLSVGFAVAMCGIGILAYAYDVLRHGRATPEALVASAEAASVVLFSGLVWFVGGLLMTMVVGGADRTWWAVVMGSNFVLLFASEHVNRLLFGLAQRMALRGKGTP